MRVYYSPLLKAYIDLDAISMISDAEFIGGIVEGYFATFHISMKLHNDPYYHSQKIEGDPALKVEMINGTWERPDKIEDKTKILGVVKLQAEIEVLVAKWCGRPFKEEPE